MRDFETWIGHFKESIATYGYYVDWNKIFRQTDSIKVELNILNSLVGSRNIHFEFMNLISRYPEIRRAIPILIAKREATISVLDPDDGYRLFDFSAVHLSDQDCALFMEKTGLFNLISNRIIDNLYDYVTGVEAGLDSNARKNRGGHLMEELVESYLEKAGLTREKDSWDKPDSGTYFKEIYAKNLQLWGLNMDPLTNSGKSSKRFDFVVCTDTTIFGIETNFYGSGGSKLNETARSYKQLAQEAQQIPGFEFVWFTDGKGWDKARGNLRETFESMEHIYSINELEDGICTKIFTNS
ncbi:type II restriction endonuclease [Mobiluncus curtisii]|uniref:Type-2 restriction enzyme n=2 Tax=Mobiluncus curtisii TaxID=2051 RepID=D6ZH53_MOBCV|nr:type II restriction endonuclease [Mobiluncus curtisii]ADI67961.1 DpmII restriction endonuclease [Mobiluncus curtisii ATCC 43063]NMW45948.1 restriction endonuclease [Mobiluncus curtisii]NMW89249.1 restriction endonuclease [Mobiluncus curtisii]QQU08375.1 type II restriction endonuclease [Mobiluncus curtisii]SQB64604.1 Type-2 restriction enzyme DpnII [Mobiluncus curtisii]